MNRYIMFFIPEYWEKNMESHEIPRQHDHRNVQNEEHMKTITAKIKVTRTCNGDNEFR